MKAKTFTYKKLAGALGVSEITVKKWMTTRDFRVENLIRIGEVLDFDFFDLLKRDQTKSPNFRLYSPEQDKYLSEFPGDMVVFIKILYNRTSAQIKTELEISNKTLMQALFRLEAAGLIELWPREKIRIRAAGPFLLRRDGLMIAKNFARLRDHLFVHFKTKFEALTLMSDPEASVMFRAFELYLSEQSRKDFVQDLMRVIAKYAQIAESERLGHTVTSPVSSIIAVDQHDGLLGSVRGD